MALCEAYHHEKSFGHKVLWLRVAQRFQAVAAHTVKHPVARSGKFLRARWRLLQRRKKKKKKRGCRGEGPPRRVPPPQQIHERVRVGQAWISHTQAQRLHALTQPSSQPCAHCVLKCAHAAQTAPASDAAQTAPASGAAQTAPASGAAQTAQASDAASGGVGTKRKVRAEKGGQRRTAGDRR